jgi:hypothetical protein
VIRAGVRQSMRRMLRLLKVSYMVFRPRRIWSHQRAGALAVTTSTMPDGLSGKGMTEPSSSPPPSAPCGKRGSCSMVAIVMSSKLSCIRDLEIPKCYRLHELDKEPCPFEPPMLGMLGNIAMRINLRRSGV